MYNHINIDQWLCISTPKHINVCSQKCVCICVHIWYMSYLCVLPKSIGHQYWHVSLWKLWNLGLIDWKLLAWLGMASVHQLLINHRHLPWLETGPCITFSARLHGVLPLCSHHVWHLFSLSLLDNFLQRFHVKKIHHASCTYAFLLYQQYYLSPLVLLTTEKN